MRIDAMMMLPLFVALVVLLLVVAGGANDRAGVLLAWVTPLPVVAIPGYIARQVFAGYAVV